MSENKKDIAPDWVDPDDAPDLSGAEWTEKVSATPVRRGRPKAGVTKVSTTIRLDPDVLDAFKSAGPGWQSRINEALRKAMGI